MTIEQPLYLGVDGGGSKCRALLVDASGQELGSGISGTANLMRGIENAQNAILDAFAMAREQAGLSEDAARSVIAGLGIAGANLPELKQALLNWQHPFSKVHVTSDLEVACLGAHRGGAGGVVIIGTGSCGLVNSDKGAISIGGHGFLLGDKGSGAWYGLRAVQCALEGISHPGSATKLSQKIFERAEVKTEMALVAKYAQASPKQFAEFAPLVFELAEEDAIAAEIVRVGVTYIEKLCLQILGHNPERFSLIGGLSHLVYKRFSKALQSQIKPPLAKPETGAVLFARQQLPEISDQKSVTRKQ